MCHWNCKKELWNDSYTRDTLEQKKQLNNTSGGQNLGTTLENTGKHVLSVKGIKGKTYRPGTLQQRENYSP